MDLPEFFALHERHVLRLQREEYGPALVASFIINTRQHGGKRRRPKPVHPFDLMSNPPKRRSRQRKADEPDVIDRLDAFQRLLDGRNGGVPADPRN